MRGLETDQKEEVMCFNRLAKAGNISFSPVAQSQKLHYQQADRRRNNLQNMNTSVLCVWHRPFWIFSIYIIFLSSHKTTQQKRSRKDNTIDVMRLPVLPSKAETSAYML